MFLSNSSLQLPPSVSTAPGWFGHRTDKGEDDPAVFGAEGVRILRTPVRAPRANAFAERWVGTVRRELVDRMLIVGRRQLATVLTACATYNDHRPHRALGQAAPLQAVPPPARAAGVRIVRVDRLGGLIHEYAQVA